MKAGRNLTHGYVTVNGVTVEKEAEPGKQMLDITTLLYIGKSSHTSFIWQFILHSTLR